MEQPHDPLIMKMISFIRVNQRIDSLLATFQHNRVQEEYPGMDNELKNQFMHDHLLFLDSLTLEQTEVYRKKEEELIIGDMNNALRFFYAVRLFPKAE